MALKKGWKAPFFDCKIKGLLNRFKSKRKSLNDHFGNADKSDQGFPFAYRQSTSRNGGSFLFLLARQ